MVAVAQISEARIVGITLALEVLEFRDVVAAGPTN
jgi:hypothetical protein